MSRIEFYQQTSVAALTPEKTLSAAPLHIYFNNKYTHLQLILIAMISHEIEICGGNDYHKEVMNYRNQRIAFHHLELNGMWQNRYCRDETIYIN